MSTICDYIVVIVWYCQIFKHWLWLLSIENDNEILLNFRSIYIILQITLYSFLQEFILWPDDGPE